MKFQVGNRSLDRGRDGYPEVSHFRNRERKGLPSEGMQGYIEGHGPLISLF